jgi:isocitrate dehydrogenase kinase/phosphatase
MAVQHLNGNAIEADAGAAIAAAPVAAAQCLAPEAVAQCIAEHFSGYNEEFGRITRRAGGHFRSGDWQAAHHDAVARIDLYEQRVCQCVQRLRDAAPHGPGHLAHWVQIKSAYEQQIQRRPDGDFYRTFFNSVTRDLHATVGVNPEVEFCATSMGRASGMVPINVYPVGAALPGALREILADQPFADAIVELEAAVRTLSAQVGRYLDSGRDSARPETIEMIAPPFYRGHEAFIVGRMIGDGAITPLILALRRTPEGVRVEPALLTRSEVSSLFGFARSYFHVDLPVVSAAVTLLRSFLPHKPVDELYTVMGRAKQGKTERYFALCRHLDASIDSFVHAPGERGLVMIVFTLPSHDLVFKVIRDRFGAPKSSSRAEVMASYRFVFHHDRAGRLVDAQEFRRLRLPRSRFMPALVDELLQEAGESCRVEGEDLIIEHCYMERRLRPLNLYLRDADPAAAEAAVIDYGQALRDLAASDVFPGDLLLKNFGVTRGGRVIFYDYDELCLVSDCKFRALPAPATEEEALSAEPWFYVGEHDVFPEQWLQFLSMSEPLREVFVRHHGELLTPAWWRTIQQVAVAAPHVRAAPQPAYA